MDTPYLALMGELRGVFCEYLWENWQRYNGIALYCAWGRIPNITEDTQVINKIRHEIKPNTQSHG